MFIKHHNNNNTLFSTKGKGLLYTLYHKSTVCSVCDRNYEIQPHIPPPRQASVHLALKQTRHTRPNHRQSGLPEQIFMYTIR
jgi:hypothetical protein